LETKKALPPGNNTKIAFRECFSFETICYSLFYNEQLQMYGLKLNLKIDVFKKDGIAY